MDIYTFLNKAFQQTSGKVEFFSIDTRDTNRSSTRGVRLVALSSPNNTKTTMKMANYRYLFCENPLEHHHLFIGNYNSLRKVYPNISYLKHKRFLCVFLCLFFILVEINERTFMKKIIGKSLLLETIILC